MTTIEEHFKSVDWNKVQKKQREETEARKRISLSIITMAMLFILENMILPSLLYSVVQTPLIIKTISAIRNVLPWSWSFSYILIVYAIYRYFKASRINVIRTSEKAQENDG